jgi:hypothetical protein
MFNISLKLLFLKSINYNLFTIMNDISEILRTLLDKTSDSTDAGQEFEKMLRADDELKSDYKAWCDEHGYDVKTGYQDYLDEIVDAGSIWNTLEEYGNDI